MTHQYPSPKEFLNIARTHQRDWLRSYLSVDPSHPKRVLIPSNQAFDGGNFFDELTIESVKARYPKAFRPRKDGSPKALIADALRSEHIPFNFFAPLKHSLADNKLTSFLSGLSGKKILNINQVLFEYAPPKGVNQLKDNTAFDACIIGSRGKHKILICIEVKYTEGSYPWGKTEKIRMFDERSSYVRLSENSSDIAIGAYINLRNRHLKQIWRNYLLATTASQIENCEFTYVHLFPRANVYQSSVCDKFSENLTPAGKKNFRSCTYEEFINLVNGYLFNYSDQWCKYLTNRYVLPTV